MKVWLITLLAISGAPVLAQEPFLQVRLQSLDHFSKLAPSIGRLADQQLLASTLWATLEVSLQAPGGREAIDRTKPIGAYADLTADVVDSPVVLLIPITNEAAFISLIEDRFKVAVKRNDAARLQVKLPQIPEPIEITFQDGYAYCLGRYGAGKTKPRIIKPDVFFKPLGTATAQVKLNFEQIPESVSRAVIANAELKFADARTRTEAGETKLGQAARAAWLGLAFEAGVQVLREGQFLDFSLALEPKTNSFQANLEFKPKPGSALQKQLHQQAARPGLNSLITQAAHTQFGMNIALGEHQKKMLLPLLDILGESAIAKNDRAAELWKRLLPTVQAGELDCVIWQPQEQVKADRLPYLFAFKMRQGDQLPNVLELIKADAAREGDLVEPNVKKQGELTLHRIEFRGQNHPLKVAGTNELWLGTSANILLASMAGEAELVKAFKLLTQPAKPGPLMVRSGSAIASLPMRIWRDPPRTALDVKGSDQFNMSVTFTDTLKLNLTVNGAVIKFILQ